MRAIIFICILIFNISSLSAQLESDIDQVELIREIQKWEKNGNNMTFSFWIPSSYWRITLSDNALVPQETIGVIESVFKDYVFVCAADIQVGTNGIMTFTSESEVRKTISIFTLTGKQYFPLSENQISSETAQIIESIRPMFAQMFGQMGKGMHFYLFEVKDSNNINIINETKKGGFTIKHSGQEFNWILPLVTLMPSKHCPIDNEEMKGNWKFCPIHGVKLDD